MNIEEYRTVFLVATAIVALLVASPALSRLLVYPRTEFFSELWLLGPNHMAEDYPFNISRNQNYKVFLGIGNRLGYCAYYLVEVKFRNQTQSAPTALGPLGNRTPSSLPSLFNITAFVGDEEVWEMPLTFSFNYGFDESRLQAVFHNMTLNDVALNLDGYVTRWNSTRRVFYGDLLFELWLYNKTAGNFQYHERFLSLLLNITR